MRTLEVSDVVKLPGWATKLEQRQSEIKGEGVLTDGRSAFSGETSARLSGARADAFLLNFIQRPVSKNRD